MKTLLQLPLEIRLQVYESAISVQVELHCPSLSQVGRKELPLVSFERSGIWQHPQRNPALPLLLVSHQVHDEVKDLMRCASTNYHVDIMFLKTYGLWTTWSIFALPQTEYIDSIHATIRLFEPTEDLDSRFQGSLRFHPGDGGPPHGVWAFYYLLAGVLAYGPGFYLAKGHYKTGLRSSPRFVVRRIIIDVLAPTDGAPHKSIVWDDKSYKEAMEMRWERGEAATIPAEQRLARLLTGYLAMLLSLDYHTLNSGCIVGECVQEDITFLINGAKFKRYDIDKLMQEHKVDYWGETPESIEKCQQQYSKWKGWVDERRRRMREELELKTSRPVKDIF